MPEQQDTIAAKNTAYLSMEPQWSLTHNLIEGTPGMRAAGQAHLPKEPGESDESYTTRLNRSFLFNAYGKTRKRLAGKPFSHPIVLKGDLPEQLDPVVKNVDWSGSDLDQLGFDMMLALEDYGMTLLYVDFPQVPEGATKATEEAMGARPLLNHIKRPQLLSFTRGTPEGQDKPELTEIRIFEEVTVKEGKFSDKVVKQIRVITQTHITIWRFDEDTEKFIEGETVEHNPPDGKIPLIAIYINKTGFLTATSPLDELAWMNTRHWQSSSDQNNILRIARVPMISAIGLAADEVLKPIVVSTGRSLRSRSKNAKFGYVEHSGAAIASGAEDLRSIEAQMVALGDRPLVEKSGNETATGKAIDESNSQCDLQMWVRRLEEGLRAGLELAAKWEKTELPEDFKVEIFNDFWLGNKSTEEIKLIQLDRDKGVITRSTYLSEAKKRRLYSEDLDVEKELAEAEAEVPPPAQSLSVAPDGEPIIPEEE